MLLNFAPTGVIPTKKMNKNTPINHQEIVEQVAQAAELGVQMVHLHCRDASGVQTSDPEPYGRLVEDIRKILGEDCPIIGVTTSGRLDNSFETRSKVLDLDGDQKPDTASLTLSSLNFMTNASINEPDCIKKLALKMLDKNIIPECEVFDLGMVNFLKVLEAKSIIPDVKYINVLLGNIAGSQTDLPTLAAFRSAIESLKSKPLTALAGLGSFQLDSTITGILYFSGARIGLEDNIWFDRERTIPADNIGLIRRLLELSDIMEKKLYSRDHVKRSMGILN